MVKVSWTNFVRNEEVLQRAKEDRNILQTIKRRKAHWVDHVGRIEVVGRSGRRSKQLLNDLKERTGY
jgi:hypothetical protein